MPTGVRSEAASSGTGAKKFNFATLLLALVALQLVLVLSWQIAVPRAGLEAATTMSSLLSQYGIVYWLLGIVAGLVLPLAVLLFHVLSSDGKEMPSGLAVAVSMLVIIGSFAFKHVFIAAGQLHIGGWL